MFSRSRATAQPADDRKDLFGPVADLMVGVIFIFIILLIGMALHLQPEDYKKMQKENAQLKGFVRYVRDGQLGALIARLGSASETRTRMLEEMRQRLDKRGVKVTIDPTNGTLKLPAGGLFLPGQAEPTPEGQETIRALGTVLAEILPCYAHGQIGRPAACPPADPYSTLSSAYIEGHTDVVPFGAPSGRFRDNWDLSAGRAIATFKLLQESEPLLREIRNQNGDALLGVSGYGETRPATEAPDRLVPDVRDMDRRIEVRLTMTANEAAVQDAVRALNRELEKVNDLAP